MFVIVDGRVTSEGDGQTVKYSFLFIYIVLFTLTLHLTAPTVDVIYADGNDYDLIVVSDEDNRTPKSYMNALLEFKASAPYSFNFSKEKVNERELSRPLTDEPAIDGKTIGKVSGNDLSTNKIVDELNSILS